MYEFGVSFPSRGKPYGKPFLLPVFMTPLVDDRAFSTPEPTILLACGRNRELWEQPFQACAIDADAQ